MRVLHVAEVLKGGTSSYMDEVLSYQKAALGGHNVAVFVPASQIDFLQNRADIAEYTFDDKTGRLKSAWYLLLGIRGIAEQTRADVVHIHGTFAGVACRMAFLASRNRPKLVYCAHGWSFDRVGSKWKNRVFGFIEKILSLACDKVICISNHDLESGKRVGIASKRMVMIHNGIGPLVESTSLTKPQWTNCKLRVLFAGRFDRQKGVDIFMSAMAQLPDDLTGIAIGDSSVGDATLPPTPPNVKLVGWLPRGDVQAYLKSCDVLVMPSRWEGFGLSALEAMRAGVAVVASNVGGLPELIEPNINGKLMEVDDIDGLTKILRNLPQEETDAMGKAGFDRYKEKFTAEAMNQKIIELYKVLLGYQPVA